MARSKFGGVATAVVYRPYKFAGRHLAQLADGVDVTFWDAETDGNQYTDLLLEGQAVGKITSNSNGFLPLFEGPDLIKTMWADAGNGRFLLITSDASIDLSQELSTRIPTAEKGAQGGVATLDNNFRLVEGVAGEKIDTGTIAEARIPALPYVSAGELILNVRDYGAVGDGVTNDASAINAAINDAAAEGDSAVVWMPYTISGYAAGALILKSNVTLRGENRVLLKRTGSATSQFIDSAGAIDVTVEGLTIDGNGLVNVATIRANNGTQNFTVRDCKLINSSSAVNIYSYDTVANSTDLVIEDCWFDGTHDSIRLNQGPQRVAIRRCLFTNWINRCVYVLGNATTGIADLTLDGNVFRDLSSAATLSDVRQALSIQGQDTALHTRVRVVNNTVIGPGTSYNDGTTPGTADQISLHRCSNFIVRGNFSVGGGDTGITVSQQCEIGAIIGNVCEGNDTVGIALGSGSSTYTRRVSVTGNTLVNNGQNGNADRPAQARTGMWANLASDIAVSGNTLGDDQGTATQQYGVSFTGSTNAKCGPDVDAGNALGLYHLDGAGNTNILEVSTAAVT